VIGTYQKAGREIERPATPDSQSGRHAAINSGEYNLYIYGFISCSDDFSVLFGDRTTGFWALDTTPGQKPI
jgi:hypothetical protein